MHHSGAAPPGQPRPVSPTFLAAFTTSALFLPRYLRAQRRALSQPLHPRSTDLMAWYHSKPELSPRLPAYTCLSSAVVAELMELQEMVVASGGCSLYGVPLHHWSPAALSVLTLADSWSLLGADSAASGTFVAQSPIHSLGVFAARPLLPGARILPFCGQLVYEDLEVAARTHADDSIVHGPDHLPLSLCCTAKDWLTTSLQLRMHRSFWRDLRAQYDHALVSTVLATKTCFETPPPSCRPAWVVPSWFCAAGYVNDPRPNHEANGRFYQSYDPISSAAQLVVAPAYVYVTRYIAAGEEVLVDYGDVYTSFSSSGLVG